MKRILSVASLCLVALAPALAHSGERNLNSSLRGDYAFSGEASCLGTRADDALSDFHAHNPGAYITTFAVEGVLRFNGDGTGTTVKGRAITINHNTNRDQGGNFLSLGTAMVSTFNGDFNYSVAHDRSIRIEREPLAITTIVGPTANTPDASTIWKGIKFDGHVSQDFKTLSIATAASDSNPPGLVLEYGYRTGAAEPYQTRACHRARTLVKISGGDKHDKHDEQLSVYPFSRR
ncbi:MAG: hypothetical protein IH605_04725 [Burkholderiales bacterium]|nr:hypothetical protein [Burkholderiales bacterium]